MASPYREAERRMHPLELPLSGLEILRQEEQERRATLLACVLDSMSDSVFVKDPDGRYLVANPAVARTFGRPAAELLGRTDEELLPAPVARRFREQDLTVLDGQTSACFQEEVPVEHEPRTLQTVLDLCRDSSGHIFGVVGVSRDTSERTRIESELRQRQRELTEAHRIARLGTWAWDALTGNIQWSAETFRIFGRLPDEGELHYADLLAAHTPASRRSLEAAIAGALEGRPYELDVEVRQPDGSTRWITARGEPEAWLDGRVVRLRGTLQDITERKRAEAALLLSETRYRSLVQVSADIVWVTNAAVEQTVELPGWQAYTGQTREEIMQLGWTDAIHPEDRQRTVAVWTAAVAAGTTFEIEHRLRRRDGVYRCMAVRAVAVRNAAGEVVEWVGTHTDITHRRETERALRSSEERLRKLSDAHMMGICIPNRFGLFKEANDELLRMTGYTREDLEAGRVRWDTMTPPEYAALDIAHIAEAAERGSCTPYEKEYIRKDGTRVPILCGFALLEGSKTDYIAFVLDLTRQKQVEDALRRSEKLATAGKLAASIAHEINNPLAAVTNSLYLALMDPALSPQTRSFLAMAEQELARVAQITTQTLRFHKQSRAAARTDLAEVVDSACFLFNSRIAAKRIEVTRECRPGSEVVCFGDEIRQVVVNLLANAVDAVTPGGRIRIRVRPSQASGTPGVRLLVADTGPGIPPSVRSRLFEPFVSTKPDIALGLGLWVSDGIVRKHGGTLTLRSRIEGLRPGTVMCLFLPHPTAALA